MPITSTAMLKLAMDDWLKDLIKKDAEFRVKYNEAVNLKGGSYDDALRLAKDHLGEAEFARRHGSPFTEPGARGRTAGAGAGGARARSGPRGYYYNAYGPGADGFRAQMFKRYGKGHRLGAGLAALALGGLVAKGLHNAYEDSKARARAADEKRYKDLDPSESSKIIRAIANKHGMPLGQEVSSSLFGGVAGGAAGAVLGKLLGMAIGGNKLHSTLGADSGFMLGLSGGAAFGANKALSNYLSRKGVEPQKGLNGLLGQRRASDKAIEKYLKRKKAA